ncbi:MAG: glycosyltransferase family 4 protein [Clostridia bacterium]|nr:glycosyltransferase family 4 protein [Clostridia bacterium]
MKILHICCNLAGSTVFPQLFEALCEAGLSQEVFVPERREADLNKNVPKGVTTHYAMTVKATDMLFFFRKAQRSVPEIEKRVDMKTVDLIHAHTLFTDGSIAEKLSEKTGVPYMLTLRYSDIGAIWKYEPHLRPMARRILRGAKHIVFLSEAAREGVLSNWLSEKDRALIEPKTAIIPNGIRPEWLTGEARTALGNPVRVGFAGKLNNRKRPLDVANAVHKASDAGERRYVLRACGTGPLENEFKALLREEDTYVGAVRGMDAMKEFYRECDMLLVPSSAETFGMVYLEAMSQGVPVLYTRGEGFDGQFPEGAAGYAVGCGDIEEQAKRIADICEGYAERSARCVELSRGYAWPIVAEKWMKLYSK